MEHMNNGEMWIDRLDCIVMENDGKKLVEIYAAIAYFPGKISVSALNYLRTKGVSEKEIEFLHKVHSSHPFWQW